MVSGVPMVFRRTSPVNVQYNYIDYIQGVGYITFYGACSVSGAAATKEYLLTNRKIDSSTYASQNSGVYTYVATNTVLDFDIDLNVGTPFTMAASKVYVNYTEYVGGTASRYSTITIYHVRGATATQLATKRATLHEGDTKFFRNFLIMTVPETRFERGDILRAKVNVSSSGTGSWRIYHDPTSSITATDNVARTIGTDFTVDIPLKLVN